MKATGCSRWFERLLAGRGFKVRIGDAAQIKTMRIRFGTLEALPLNLIVLVP